jgi:hypothetical protein
MESPSEEFSEWMNVKVPRFQAAGWRWPDSGI